MRVIILTALLWGVSFFASAANPVVPLTTPCPVSVCMIYNQAFVHVLTGDKVDYFWGDAGNGAGFSYTFQLLAFPPVAGAIPVAQGTFANTVHTWKVGLPRAGLYYLRGISCVTGVTPDPANTIDCSRWAVSYDPADTSPTSFPRGVIIEVKLKGLTGGT